MFIVISIHALRVEGDAYPGTKCVNKLYFYPRPPGGGRRCRSSCRIHHQRISIHALRVEGDLSLRHQAERSYISIHALRVEGDATSYSTFISSSCNFYPRPPGGGRPRGGAYCQGNRYFYPRPPGGGRQQKRTKFSSVFAKKGEEFASLRRGKRKICRWRFKKDKFWVLIWCEGSRKSVCALASHCG